MRAESALSLYFTWPSRLGIGLNQNHGMFSFLQVTLYLIYIHFTINQTVCRWFRRQISNQQVKSITFLVWKFRFIILNFLLYLQNLSNPLLFTNCCGHSKELTCLNYDLMQKSRFKYVNCLKSQQQFVKSSGFDKFCKK